MYGIAMVPATTRGVSCYSVKFLIPCSYMAGLPEGWSPFLFGGQEPLELPQNFQSAGTYFGDNSTDSEVIIKALDFRDE